MNDINRKIAARILLIPALAGFIVLFALNFAVIAIALISVSAGIICAPLGGIYSLGFVKVISDLSPSALTAAGFFFLFFGCFLSLFELKLAPFCARLFLPICLPIYGQALAKGVQQFQRYQIFDFFPCPVAFVLWSGVCRSGAVRKFRL